MSSVLLDFAPPSQKMSFFDCRPRKSKKFKVTFLQGVCCNTIDGNRDSDWCHVGACMVFSACHQPRPQQPQGEEVKLLITSNHLWNNLITGFVLAGFFSWPCAWKNYPSRKFIQPQLWYFQSSGGLSHEKYSATLGLQPKKRVEFLGAEFVGDLQGINRTLATGTLSRDVCPRAPMVPKLILDIFCVPCTPGGCALFWEWKFIPKKTWPQEMRDKFGYNTP